MTDSAADGESTASETDADYDPDATHAFPDHRLNELLPALTTDPEITTLVAAQNVNPVTRMHYNDHGPKHVEIIRNRALQLYELLKDAGIECNAATDHGLDESFEPVIIALAATLHDIGHVVHRKDHPYYSIPPAADILDRFLGERFETETAVQLKSEVLHAIVCHHVEETPLTIEAGIIRVADGLDMERGRSRTPYEHGGRGINTISSRAIEAVRVEAGSDTPVVVEIEMTNAAGVYQVDHLLHAKLTDSLLEEHISVVALNTDSNDGLVERVEL